MARLYLDNAATSWPKPNTVYEAVDQYQRQLGAAAGRGAYQSAQQAQRLVAETRAAYARLLGISDPRQLAFTANGTASLNLAIHGLLCPNDHVVTTVCEHNSVLRPLHWHATHNDVKVTYVGCDHCGYVDPTAIAEAITPTTKLIAVTHASNVTGAIQPIAEIAEIAHDADALLLVDAAQTAGCVPLNVEHLDIDLLACGGHKGLLGPLGSGLLYIRPGVEDRMRASIQGGTGVKSSSSIQPEQLPEKFEAGNLNLPAIAGLGAAAKFIEEETVENLQRHHQELTAHLLTGLAEIPGVTVYGPTADQPRVGVVSCAIDGYDPQEFAAALDASCEIECRAGLHCAPRIHKALGSAEQGGLVRFSPGWSTTAEEIDQAIEAIASLASLSIQ